ncbi:MULTISPECIES: hypothetical protein [unclassified Thiomonas]|jgi:hypothetical protein|uniref:hypothetical protein n=1 Tax=unclassified Thiomonas TaxID=2625466 RepID=UPI000BCF1578|nr:MULTISPECIES: hypothetical protein [unclassified Thiomonas]OZB71356.1 MAG: hypothetical protein B7X30_04655 [Thiomonas sp. 13-64-67]
MNRARMLEALSPAARARVGEYIDPADAWLAEREGISQKKARNRARNLERSLGKSWPDTLPDRARVDPEDSRNTQQAQGFYGLDPLEMLAALEAVAEAIAAAQEDKTRARFIAAALREAETRQIADVFHVTQRRAQQIKKKQVEDAIDSQQFALFEGGEEE